MVIVTGSPTSVNHEISKFITSCVLAVRPHFPTKGHPENLSVSTKNCHPARWKISAAVCSNGRLGGGSAFSGSRCWDGSKTAQEPHDRIIFLISFVIPGQKTVCVARCRVRVSPWCDAWRCCRIDLRMSLGITSRWPRKMTSFITDNSVLSFQYGCNSKGSSDFSFRNPMVMTCFRCSGRLTSGKGYPARAQCVRPVIRSDLQWSDAIWPRTRAARSRTSGRDRRL